MNEWMNGRVVDLLGYLTSKKNNKKIKTTASCWWHGSLSVTGKNKLFILFTVSLKRSLSKDYKPWITTSYNSVSEVTSVIFPLRCTPSSVPTPSGPCCSACCSSASLRLTRQNVRTSASATRSSSPWPASTRTWPKFLPQSTRFLIHTQTHTYQHFYSYISVPILSHLIYLNPFLYRSQWN